MTMAVASAITHALIMTVEWTICHGHAGTQRGYAHALAIHAQLGTERS
jgi:hypothetical protein